MILLPPYSFVRWFELALKLGSVTQTVGMRKSHCFNLNNLNSFKLNGDAHPYLDNAFGGASFLI